MSDPNITEGNRGKEKKKESLLDSPLPLEHSFSSNDNEILNGLGNYYSVKQRFMFFSRIKRNGFHFV